MSDTDNENCEELFHLFLNEVQKIKFERVHSIGLKEGDALRPNVVKLSFFKDKELVLRVWRVTSFQQNGTQPSVSFKKTVG